MSAESVKGAVLQEASLWAKKWIVYPLNEAGQSVLLALDALRHIRFGWEKREAIRDQLEMCAWGGLPVTALVATFSAMTLAYLTAAQLRELGQESAVGIVVMVGTCREIAPLMTGLALSGLIASKMAAEIGSMRVSEEIDALEVMSISPVKYLVMPRVVAMIVVAPALTLLADVAGIQFGAVVTRVYFDVDRSIFFSQGKDWLKSKDLWGGLAKSVVFGIMLSTVGCRQGLRAVGGPSGVGRSTLRAGVISMVFVVILDFVLDLRIYD